jgi:hypothetical protein
MPAPILTPDQLSEFDRRGVLHLPAFYPQSVIALMADRLWADLRARFGMRRDAPESWTTTFPAQFQSLVRSGAFDPLGSPALFDLADTLLGPGNWELPRGWGSPLVTFPTPTPAIPHAAWHLDIGGGERLEPMPTLRVFTFLEPLLPNGGGTLYVAGSHHLAIEIERKLGSPVKSAQVRSRLAADHPWFAKLLATPLAGLHALMGSETQIGPHRIRLEQMTAAPGDLIVMHPALLHGVAHNALSRPRLMLTEWIKRKSG